MLTKQEQEIHHLDGDIDGNREVRSYKA